MNEQAKREPSEPLGDKLWAGGGIGLPAKVVQVIESRKVWAATIGLATTLALWGLGEIDGARAVEAMTWVLGIFIGSVALEDGMTRLFSSLAHAISQEVGATDETASPALEGNEGMPPLSE